ncbi:MAG: hypothetical protein IJM90_01325 [Firmicutes bacterium]|nr:hypothetical protein [Bacillota bacterium]
MVYQNLEFHNVEALEDRLGGKVLQRFTQPVRYGLGYQDHDRGRFYSQMPVGCEIRFVTDAHFFRISLMAYEKDTRIFVFRGDFLMQVLALPAGVVRTFHIEEPPRFADVEPEVLSGHRFSSDIWRIVMDKEAAVIWYEADFVGHEVRPPHSGEVPARKWLAYGSSITFGGDAHLALNAYAMRTARLLGLDLYNKAIAGACFCDETVADYLAELAPQMDLVTLELGINMIHRFTEEIFKERTYRLIGKIRRAAPDTKVAVITPFMAGEGYRKDRTAQTYNRYHHFTQILKEYPDPEVTIVDGRTILDDFAGLSADLVHPSDEGHMIMAIHLAEVLRGLL